MSTSIGACDRQGGSEDKRAKCPRCAGHGQKVAWQTVRSLAKAELPAEPTEAWLCRTNDCEVTYYADDLTLETADVAVVPGFKTSCGGLLCYCFGHSVEDVEEELARTGSTTVVERIRSEIKAGNCACESRNPSGRCCLGEVQKMVQLLRRTA